MSLEITGRICVKYDTQVISDKFSKREFVLELQEEINGTTYTNYAKMQLVKTRCTYIDNFNVGDTVKVLFNVVGNKWERDGKVNYITSLDVWKIEAANTSNRQPAPSQQQPQQQPQQSHPYNQEVDNNLNPDSDLPF